MWSIFWVSTFATGWQTRKRHRKGGVYFWLIPALIGLCLTSVAFPGALMVNWNANVETDLAGYKIYYGTHSLTYNQTIDVGNTTQYKLENLLEGQTYYVVVTAYDTSGNESLPSSEASAKVGYSRVLITSVAQGVKLTWAPVSGATGYDVYQGSTASSISSTPVATVTGNYYVDESYPKKANSSRFYTVKASASGQTLHEFEKVGAYSVHMSKGKNLVSIPFTPAEFSISGVLVNQLTGSNFSAAAAKIMVYKNDGKYEIAWKVEGTGTAMDGKWVTESGAAESSIQLNSKNSFWIDIRPEHADSILTFTGAVPTDSNKIFQLVQGWNFIGSCYPVDVPLSLTDLYKDGVVKGANNSAQADKLLHWNGSRFEAFWLVDGTHTSWDGKWMNESGTAEASLVFKPGRGYVLWIKNPNTNTVWTYPNPEL
jgi:hypothetical protein